MVDKELLEAIGQMMDAKLAQQRKEIMQDVKALLDTDVQTRFNLLAEDLDILKENYRGQKIWMQCKNSLTYTMPCSKSTPVKYLT